VIRAGGAAAQSLVEFALIAPIVILLAMATWDGGSVLREQIVLQQAARDGARVAATAYGGATTAIVTDAVLASATDLPALTGQMVRVSKPNPQSITVSLRYPHTLITPVLRQLWGSSGTLTLVASATFFVPQLTPTPAAVVPSTPTATPSPTPTVTPSDTPTPTITPTPTPTLVNPCSSSSQSLPALNNNTGYWCTLSASSASKIVASWQDNFDPNNQILVYLNNPGPFVGQTDPSSLDPNKISSTNLATIDRGGTGVLRGSTTCVQPGIYSIYFFNRGNSYPASSGNVSTTGC
jgi:hypothetical protein